MEVKRLGTGRRRKTSGQGTGEEARGDEEGEMLSFLGPQEQGWTVKDLVLSFTLSLCFLAVQTRSSYQALFSSCWRHKPITNSLMNASLAFRNF